MYIAVITTGIYCRPSCPARKPLRHNCRFYITAAAAVRAGFRACRRCRPDAMPGSRQWDVRGDLAARAIQMIRDGVVDEVGVAGLAGGLNVSERHLHRVLTDELGTGPQQLNRTRRAQTARMLIEQTAMNLAEVAFAAGFASVRQFNEVIRAEFGESPSRLRRSGPAPAASVCSGPPDRMTAVALRLRYRPPLAVEPLRRFLSAAAVPGLDRVEASGSHTRIVRTRHGPATVTVLLGEVEPEHVRVVLRLPELSELSVVVARVRRWLDLDADPDLIDSALQADPLLQPLVLARPGIRVPGTVDGFETTLLMMLKAGSQGPPTRLLVDFVQAYGDPAADGLMAFPTAETLAEVSLDALQGVRGVTPALAIAVNALAEARTHGLVLAPGADRRVTKQALTDLPGMDRQTVDEVALRVLGDPDSFPCNETVDESLADSSYPDDADSWRPWRGYAWMHLLDGPHCTVR